MKPLILTGVRASGCVVCPRQGYYQGISAPTDPLHDRDEALLQMRSDQNNVVVARHAAEFRSQGYEVVEEVEIPWGPNGVWTGHGDMWLPGPKAIYEYTFTKDCALPERKAKQVSFYGDKLGAEIAVVCSLDPQTGEMLQYPIDIDEYREELRGMERTVVAAIASHTPPARVCKSPGDGPARWCSFPSTCFADEPVFEYPDPTHITDESIVALATELADAIDERGMAKKTTEALDDRVRALQEQIAARVLHGVENVAGPVMVKVIDVAGRETLSLSDLRKAGHDLPDDIAAFVKQGDGHTRFTVKRLA